MAKNVHKITNNTTNIQPLAKTASWSDFIQNNAHMQFPEKDDWRKRFIYTLFEWASQEDSLEIMDFYVEMKMYRSTIYKWADRYPDIKEALDFARQMIASRRRKGSMMKKLDGAYAYRDMHTYDSEWLAVNKYHSDMKTEEAKQSHTFIINDSKPRIVSKEEMANEVEE